MPTYSTVAVTLGTRELRDAQRIVHFLSVDRGKIEATARGIGKPGSKLTPATEPFTLSRLFLAEGRTLHHLTQCEVQRAFYGLRLDVGRLARASYAAELVDRTTEPGEPLPQLFDLLVDTFAALEKANDQQVTLWAFELGYLDLMGLAPQLAGCVVCEQPLGARPAGFSAALGGVLCPQCAAGRDLATVQPATLRALGALREAGPAGADRVTLPTGTRAEVGAIVDSHLDYHVDVPLHSRRFLRSLTGGTARGER